MLRSLRSTARLLRRPLRISAPSTAAKVWMEVMTNITSRDLKHRMNNNLKIGMRIYVVIDDCTFTLTRLLQTGKIEAAESLENCAIRFRKGALDVVKSTKVAQMLGPEAVAPGMEDMVTPQQGGQPAPGSPGPSAGAPQVSLSCWRMLRWLFIILLSEY